MESNNDKSTMRSAFIVFNNPQKWISDNGLPVLPSDPQEMCDKVLSMWMDSKKGGGRYGAVIYCIAHPNDNRKKLIHLHMVLECPRNDTFKFSAVKKLFPLAHIEITKGDKAEAEAYINKTGHWSEKDEIVIAKAQFGDLVGKAGNSYNLAIVNDLIKSGKTPNQIYEDNFSYRRMAKEIERAYFEYKIKKSPVIRNVNVEWRYGTSGTGKTSSLKNLIDEYGREEIYIVSDLSSSGAFDNYLGEKILFLDELSPDGITYKYIKNLLDVYTFPVHCRYRNSVALWEKVVITTTYSPEDFYNLLVPYHKRKLDGIEQLCRRITKVYHHTDSGIFENILTKDGKLLPFC